MVHPTYARLLFVASYEIAISSQFIFPVSNANR